MQSKYDIIGAIKDKEMKMEVAKICDDFFSAKEYGIGICTQFLTPHMLSFVIQNFNDKDVDINIFGGYEPAERVCVCFCAKGVPKAFEITTLKISYNKKYSRELRHSDFLGSIMGLQIKRELIGDIVFSEEHIYIFVCDSIADFIISNLKKVGSTNVKIEKTTEKSEFIAKEPNELTTTVTSMRIDVVIAKVFNMSRTEAKKYFENGKVFINWIGTEDVAKLIAEGDVITVRGLGRIKYIENNGLNKKDKIKIVYLKY